MKKSPAIFLICLFLLLATIPILSSDYGIDWMTKTIIFGIFALSLELLVGRTGLVCFGQAAFFGIGAYSAVIFSTDVSQPLVVVLLPISLGLAGLYALFVGALSLRTKGVYFIMVTLAFAQMAYYVIHDTPIGGGTDGIYLFVKPTLPGHITIDSSLHFYLFTVFILFSVLGFLGLITRSRFGRALLGIKLNEQRMKAIGYNTYFYKLAAFVISGAIAGLAGFLFALKDGFVNPELLSWHQSGAVLIMIILGGLGYLRGALIGAFAYNLLEEFFRSEAIFGVFTKHWHLGLGIAIILCVALLPKGLIGLPSLWQNKLFGKTQELANENDSVVKLGEGKSS
jgi:branched-chain amino acid transport system permease protein